MESFVKGDVVFVPFPFTNLTESKRRPALVLADLGALDLVLCQITTRSHRDPYSVAVDIADFSEGALKYPSNIRSNLIFTMEKALVLSRAGRLNRDKTTEVVNKIVEYLRGT